MTIPIERTRSIHNAREFLRSLLDPKKTPGVPKKVRIGAYGCLRHFPSDNELARALAGDKDIFEKLPKKELESYE